MWRGGGGGGGEGKGEKTWPGGTEPISQEKKGGGGGGGGGRSKGESAKSLPVGIEPTYQ